MENETRKTEDAFDKTEVIVKKTTKLILLIIGSLVTIITTIYLAKDKISPPIENSKEGSSGIVEPIQTTKPVIINNFSTSNITENPKIINEENPAGTELKSDNDNGDNGDNSDNGGNGNNDGNGDNGGNSDNDGNSSNDDNGGK